MLQPQLGLAILAYPKPIWQHQAGVVMHRSLARALRAGARVGGASRPPHTASRNVHECRCLSQYTMSDCEERRQQSMIDRVRRLLEAGYLPSQLPPTFTTRQLAADHATYYQAWIALQKKPKKGQPFVPKAEPGKPEAFSVARVGHQRRVTSIPNPVTQTYLATHVAAHWGSFVKHYRQSRLSASHPRFLHNGARAASIPSMHMLYVGRCPTGSCNRRRCVTRYAANFGSST